ncbi:MAG: hypothetical protein WCY15_16500 [Phenylobacterium sp.]|jgi:hypothetical protein|nr:hypothetical protein [Phenylobacterium sp.]MDX9999381.1 hypothetical protein [Phenylobacterium sp.]
MRVSAAGQGRHGPGQALGALVLLAFVMLLAIGFWAGAVWIGRSLIALAV